ncbi:MAG: microtubule-binding protein [Bdellovibrionales bacterium]|nr:microtubule-binding protein [Bdellovibrionales bacterium]
MSFDYQKAKKQTEHGSDSMWTSYSDLFLMLSIVFLLLYVTASVKTQTSSLQKNIEYQKLSQKAADLEQQIQVYNALKEQQLKESSEKEQEVYNRLMNKLTLLKEDAKNEKEDLRKQAKENEEKELALNEYQQMIRNIINNNILAKSKIKNREELITNKETKIGEQRTVIANKNVEIAHNQEEIEDLNADIQAKTRNLNANRALIKSIKSQMDDKIAKMTAEQKRLHSSREQLNKKIASLRKESDQKVSALESKNNNFMKELNSAKSNLASVSGQLAEAQNEVQNTRAQANAEMARLKSEHAARMKAERGAFEDSLRKERLSGQERAKRIAAYAAQSKAREAELAGKLGDVERRAAAAESQVEGAKAEAAGARAAADAARGQAERLRGEKEGLQRNMASLNTELKHAQEIANARKMLAGRIQSELKKAGLKGTVDGKTGDVTLAFGEEYFDTGSAHLKPTMERTLEKFLPGYSRSLFKDGQIAEKIENVEIIGFASSTYGGRYVAPDSLRPEDQAAVNYNLKLSFDRANSIFKHIFDTKQMKFEHQKELLPKIKVVGRGFLPDGKTSDDFRNGMPEREFCKQYNCKSAQKVIIKFKLKD